ncbi:glycerol kinase GlpK [Levilactobacillus namurensis]|uniref:glycerol kinase GlpK n=1 Tax=Levilactobacillus namurensis TaxID=380393 RepID=UPI00222F0823|nr:glycerol kinase GlpK [Levilactobacillus namurensis]MCW3779289.1 glycerol kinase GlpK [Levilactobacillus namurensis]MDT7019492.1 glycerol kinase GlpK [Levilactobacillus namurensis]WNN65916.1 glycerol kinase GlpK [Levilactobacillus namurensis]
MSLKQPENYILAIDQGTSSTRALIFDHTGRKVIEGYKEVPQYYPHAGWVESDANEIWNSVLSVIASALIDASIHPENIQAIGISSQRETTIVWDKATGEPIYHAIGWQSQQTAKYAKQLAADHGQEIQDKTGLVVNAYFSATKVRWILDHVAGARERAENGELAFGTVDSWLAWKLSGGRIHVTDYSNASRTMLFNIHDLQWDADILSWLDIPAAMLPEVKSSSEIYGVTQNFQFYGVEVPIAGLIGDQSAALLGQLALKPGMVKNTYGDGAFAMMNTGTQPQTSKHNLLTTIAYKLDGDVTYALEGSIMVAGTALAWLHDSLKIIDNVPESRQAAMASTDDDEVYVVPAFNGLGAPYWDPDARGAVFGLTRGSNRNDFVKATLQSIAYQTRDVLTTMTQDTGITISELMADGGASRNRYLMQFQADILNTPVQRSSDEETTALGAAIAAGLAVGYWQDLEEVKQIRQAGRLFTPDMTSERRERLYAGWQQAVSATRAFKPQPKD